MNENYSYFQRYDRYSHSRNQEWHHTLLYNLLQSGFFSANKSRKVTSNHAKIRDLITQTEIKSRKDIRSRHANRDQITQKNLVTQRGI